MEKEYFKKFLDLDDGNESLIVYDQLPFLISEEETENYTFRDNFDLSPEEELEVTDQFTVCGYNGEEEVSDTGAEEGLETEEIREHEGLVATYFREMLRYSILSPEEERELGRIIKHGQEGVLQLVLQSQADLEELAYLKRKVEAWFQAPEKSAQAKEKLFRLIHQTLQRLLRHRPEAQEIRVLMNRIRATEGEVTQARDKMIKAPSTTNVKLQCSTLSGRTDLGPPHDVDIIVIARQPIADDARIEHADREMSGNECEAL